ncbi:UNVERIFIED_CONTAM: putative ribonuclease H protein [Sesamum latifolium]|uniref:Ribonuclease H protein n=1 Tax=Sesamum latifolium TaxID=2727402 RepID=A0AAW2WWG6_9LAMI
MVQNEYDGASKGNPGISGAGGILRDQLGRVIFAFQEPLGNITNTQAELQAIHRGLQICIDRGFRNVWIETDATAIIKLISAPQRGAWNLQAILSYFSRRKSSGRLPRKPSMSHTNRAYFLRTPSQLLLGDFRTVFCAVSVAPFGAVFGAGGAHLGAVSGAIWGLVLGLFGDYFLGTVEGYFTAVMLLLGLQLGGCFGAVSGAGWGLFLGQLRTFYLLFLGYFGAVFVAYDVVSTMGKPPFGTLLFVGTFWLLALFVQVLVGSDDSSVVAETFWTHRIIVTNFTHATSLFVRE